MANPKIILASGSPGRQSLMQLAGIPCEVVVSGADETVTGTPDEQVQELALRKARAVKEMMKGGGTIVPSWGFGGNAPENHSIIIAADTIIFLNGRVLGKPRNEHHAFEMLKSLSGRMHMVYTGVAIVQGDYEHVFADATRVYFRAFSDEEIHAYIATGEPFGKSGSYSVQGRGSVLVDRIDGCFYTVVGLPLSKMCRALSVMGYDSWGSE